MHVLPVIYGCRNEATNMPTSACTRAAMHMQHKSGSQPTQAFTQAPRTARLATDCEDVGERVRRTALIDFP
eukprot:674967-Alexandrium_andersonii.AAC.1